ncbi:MAG: PAS domain-containing sensor histidine kinase [Janthinobacterium lividum]
MPAAALPFDLSASHALLHDLLAVSLTGINLLRPLYGSSGELYDFALEYLNPAAQRMTGLSEQPGGTTRTRFPDLFTNGVFDFYRRVFETGEAGRYSFNYQADGFDNYFHVAARRSGELLVVNFTDTADQDRSPVELALRESQAREQAARAEAEAERRRFYDVLQQLPALVATYHGPDHVYDFANSAYQRYFHRDVHLLGHAIRQVLPEAKEQGVFALMDRVYQTGEPYYASELEVWMDYTGGEAPRQQVFLDLLLHPLRDAQGEVNGLLDFSYDVTEQVQARRQVQQLNQELEARVQARTREVEAARAATERQRRQWEELFRTAPAGICIFDGPEWVYQFVNPGYQAMFPGRQLLGKRLVDALPEVADQPLMAILHHVYDTGEPFQETEVLVPLARTEGGPIEDIYFDLTYLARHDEQGQIDGFVTYAYDVTEQVHARRERDRQQRQLHELFEQAPVAIAIFRGPHYRIELANPAVCTIWGRTPQQALGTPLFELLPEAAGQGFEQLLDGVMTTGIPYVAHELPSYIHREGRRDLVHWNFVYQPLADSTGRNTGVTVVATEVSEQVQARQRVQSLNEELQAANDELQESNRQLRRTNVDLDTFVYTASHDLKAPISNIESILLALRAQLPAEVQQDELVAQLLEMLQGTVGRFQLTIAQLTDVAKLQLAHAGAAEPVLVAQVVEDVRQDLGPLLKQAATHLTIEVAPDLLVSFSPANLRSVVYNLLSNAIKYRDPTRPSQVLVRAAQTSQAVVLTVQDNGLGMSDVQQRQLFRLFQRLHTHVEGTGVGLYIVKRLVENGGGTITVQSQPDAGSTFTVTIPYSGA